MNRLLNETEHGSTPELIAFEIDIEPDKISEWRAQGSLKTTCTNQT
jgi:hypothetical protein